MDGVRISPSGDAAHRRVVPRRCVTIYGYRTDEEIAGDEIIELAIAERIGHAITHEQRAARGEPNKKNVRRNPQTRGIADLSRKSIVCQRQMHEREVDT